METINISLNWKQSARMLIVLLENGNVEGKAYAKAEIMRMADIIDRIPEDTVML